MARGCCIGRAFRHRNRGAKNERFPVRPATRLSAALPWHTQSCFNPVCIGVGGGAWTGNQMFHGLALSLLALAVVTPPDEPALPEALEQNMAACESAEAPPEAIIAACNALIQFDRFDRDDQAAIFFDLGRAWHLKGDYDRA